MRRVASNRKVLFGLMALSVSVFLLLAGSPLFSAADSAARRPLSRVGLVIPTSPGFDSLQAGYPSVLLENGIYKMWYFGCDPSYFCQIGYATSADGRHWSKLGVVLSPSLPEEGSISAYPEVRNVAGQYRMWYNGFDGVHYRILAADSPNGVDWTKRGVVLDVGAPGEPDQNGVGLARVVYDQTGYRMWYTALTVPSSIMLATSPDGLTWTRQGVVLTVGAPGELDSFGVQGSAVVEVGGVLEMIYTGLPDSSTSRLFFAKSTDGVTWTRLGLALDILPPNENLIAHASFVVRGDNRLAVYYVARGGYADLQIYLAVGPFP